MKTSKQGEHYYFAYGSNMWPDKLRQWGVEARYIANGLLESWEFKMNKRGKDGYARANIEPAAGRAVWGVLYQVDGVAIEKLDAMEGLGRGYRADWLPVAADGTVYQAYTYIGIKLAEGLPITVRYRDMILQGAEHFRLVSEYRDMLRQCLAGAV